jgi:hypothetical protein
MTPFDQIKKIAGHFVFNQVLYPRDTFLNEEDCQLSPDIEPFLESLFGKGRDKIAFAKNWCQNHTGSVLDLSNNTGKLANHLATNKIPTFALENSPVKIQALRKIKENLSEDCRHFLHIYPIEVSKFEIDEIFQTIFASSHVLEQTETELAFLGLLRKTMAHLNPDGSFFVEVHNLDFFENRTDFRESVWHYALSQDEDSAIGRLWERTYPGNKESQTVFEYAVSDSLNEFSLYRSTLHLFNLDQWMKLFEVAGYLVEDCYGDWTGKSISFQNPLIVFHLKAR